MYVYINNVHEGVGPSSGSRRLRSGRSASCPWPRTTVVNAILLQSTGHLTTVGHLYNSRTIILLQSAIFAIVGRSSLLQSAIFTTVGRCSLLLSHGHPPEGCQQRNHSRHKRPFVGVSRPRSWSHFLVFVIIWRESPTFPEKSFKIDFWIPPRRAVRGTFQRWSPALIRSSRVLPVRVSAFGRNLLQHF